MRVGLEDNLKRMMPIIFVFKFPDLIKKSSLYHSCKRPIESYPDDQVKFHQAESALANTRHLKVLKSTLIFKKMLSEILKPF